MTHSIESLQMPKDVKLYNRQDIEDRTGLSPRSITTYINELGIGYNHSSTKILVTEQEIQMIKDLIVKKREDVKIARRANMEKARSHVKNAGRKKSHTKLRDKKLQMYKLIKKGYPVRQACNFAEIHHSKHYRWLESDPDYKAALNTL